MNRGGTQSFFFRIVPPMMIFLAIVLLALIFFGIAKHQGFVSFSPN